jgi:outer membrane receptor for Fe3+-dicitrate
MSVRLLASKLLEDSTDTGNAFQDEEGQIGNTVRGLFTVTYSDGPLNISSNARFVGGGTVDNEYAANDGRVNNIRDYVYVGASVRYDFIDTGDHTVTGFVRVNNLLDQDPPIIPGTGQQPGRTDPGVYDVLGRNYAIGLTVEF